MFEFPGGFWASRLRIVYVFMRNPEVERGSRKTREHVCFLSALLGAMGEMPLLAEPPTYQRCYSKV